MNVSRRSALGGLLAAGVAGPLRAADWPTHALTWLVPSTPGGSNDIFARPVAAHVGERLGQPVVVDNRGGAAGTIGGMVAARAAPDGYTLLVGNTGLTFANVVYAESGFDLQRDFTALSLLARVPVALVVNPSKLPAKDLAGFLAAARKSPGTINIGSSERCTIPPPSLELTQQPAGLKLNHGPHPGRGQAPQ